MKSLRFNILHFSNKNYKSELYEELKTRNSTVDFKYRLYKKQRKLINHYEDNTRSPSQLKNGIAFRYLRYRCCNEQ